MKTVEFLKYLFLIVALVLTATSCRIHASSSNSGKIPPGQAKKMSGNKSAKAHAPGQQKKN